MERPPPPGGAQQLQNGFRFICPGLSLVLGLMFKGDVSKENGTVFRFRVERLLREW